MAKGEKNKPAIRDAWRTVEEAERWEIIRRREGIPRPAAVFHRLALAVETHLDRLAKIDFQNELILAAAAEDQLLRKLQAWSECPEDADRRSEIQGSIEELAQRLTALTRWTDRQCGSKSDELARVKNALARASEGLERWRARFFDKQYRGTEGTVGLALSGGGIRSATFNLGVLQALDDSAHLGEVDYLSTVSGGGYIGSSLTYLKAREAAGGGDFNFPLSAGSDQLAWIRRHTRYLTPGDGMNLLALGAAYIRGFLVNLALFVPLIVVFLLLLDRADQIGALAIAARWPITAVIAAIVLLYTWRKWVSDRKIPKDFLKSFALLVLPTIVIVLILDQGHRIDGLALQARWAIAAVIAAIVLLFAWSKWVNERKIPENLMSQRPLSSVILVLALVLALRLPETLGSHWWLTVPIALTAGAALLGVVAFLLRDGWLARLVSRVADLLLGRHDDAGIRSPKLLPFEPLSWIGGFGLSMLTIELSELPQRQYPSGFLFLFFVGLALVGKYLVSQVFLALLSGTRLRLEFQGNRYFSVQYGDTLGLGASLLLIGAIPQLHHWLIQLQHWLTQLLTAGVPIGGAVSTAVGWLLRSKGNEEQGYVAILLRVGLALLIVSGLLWLYHIAAGIGGSGSIDWPMSIISGAVWLIAIGVTDINYVSMHRYYRNRLMEAYFGPLSIDESHRTSPADKSDNLDFANIDVGASRAPYPLVNANQVTVGYEDEFYRLRGGDSFVFSPRYVGSDATAWAETVGDFRRVDLATAMAVSGAAVDPNTGETRSLSLRVVMAILNARLGYWRQSPGRKLGGMSRLWSESWTHLILREMIKMPKKTSSYVRLSDGGHFENLGLYELVRRRCRLIVVSDAGADPDFKFSDLTRAVERIRVDFDAHVELDVEDLRPDKETRLAKKSFAKGRIRYGDSDAETELVFMKTTLFPGLPQDVAGYAREHERFPDESTADQFFSEEQFEAYRELGFRAGKNMVESIQWP